MLKTSNKPKRLSIKMPPVEEDRKIVAAAKLDPNAEPLTKAQLAQMVPMKALRGRPKLENKKVLLSVRYSRTLSNTSSQRARVGNRAWIAC
jgi:hypothetical protein